MAEKQKQVSIPEDIQFFTEAFAEPASPYLGYNPRFPNQNQSKHCWAAFVEYQKCSHDKGDPEDEACKKFQIMAEGFCPSQWVSDWKSQVEAGAFPGQETWLTTLRKKH